MNNKHKVLKTALIGSLLLNLAFVGGFIVRKISSASTDTSMESSSKTPAVARTEAKQKSRGKYRSGRPRIHRVFAENQKLQELHRQYKSQYREKAERIAVIRKELLQTFLTSDKRDPAVQKFLSEINTLSRELNRLNFEYLLNIKRVLPDKDFSLLVNRMKTKLDHQIQHRQRIFDHSRKPKGKINSQNKERRQNE